MQVHNFMYKLIISLNFNFLALVILEFLCPRKKFLNKYRKKKRKGHNCHTLNWGAETAFPDASKFETFILLLQLVFEVEMFKPPIGISVFGSETRITLSIISKICSKNDLYVPHLRSKF